MQIFVPLFRRCLPVDLIETLDPNSLVFDVGCGPGRVLGLLVKRGIRCIGVDRSRVSLGLAVNRYGCPGVVGDNLSLPFANGVADAVISDGVIHHTDDPRGAFAENLRTLKPGGLMYLGVYKPYGRYPLLYKFPGDIIRRGLDLAGVSLSWSSSPRFPYFLVHFIRSKRQANVGRRAKSLLRLFCNAPCRVSFPRGDRAVVRNKWSSRPSLRQESRLKYPLIPSAEVARLRKEGSHGTLHRCAEQYPEKRLSIKD